jgi:hypothetical protein
VQWLQLYEINVDLVASVLKAISANFSDYAVYASDNSDIMVIARKNGQMPALDADVLKMPAIADALKKIHIEGIQDIEIRRIGNKRIFSRLLETFPIQGNSDYYPVLDQNAARVRFLRSMAQELLNLHYATTVLSGAGQQKETTNITPSPDFDISQQAFSAMGLRDYFLHGDARGRSVSVDLQQKAVLLKQMCAGNAAGNANDRLELEFSLSNAMSFFLTSSDMEAVWKTLATGPCDALASSQEREWFRLFKAVGTRDAGKMLEGAKSLLASGKDLSPGLKKYLLGVGMLGAISQGKREASSRLWSEYGGALFDDGNKPTLLLRMLAAESSRS